MSPRPSSPSASPRIATVTSLNMQGNGVALVEGKPCQIPYSLPGETVSFSAPQGGYARLEQVITPAKDRITPLCPHFTECGGCQLQHLETETYRIFKEKRALEAVERAGFGPECLQPLVRIPEKTRRRATLKVHYHRNQARLGFYKARSHHLVHIKSCLVLTDAIMALISHIETVLTACAHTNKIDEVHITQSDSGMDLLLSATTSPELTTLEHITLFADTHNIARIAWKTKHGADLLLARRPVSVTFGEVSVNLPLGTFLQASPEGQKAITEAVLRGLSTTGKVIDLYAGCGTYSLPLAAYTHVHAVEGSTTMIAALQSAIRGTPYVNRLTVECRDLFHTPVPSDHLRHYDAVVINPPRNGATPQVQEIADSRVRMVAMVSCNPSTFSRDASLLQAAGYRLCEATPIDQFIFSHHLEIVGIFIVT